MTLYTYYRSSCSYRVRIALYYKGLEFESKTIHLINNEGEQFTDSYKKVNPLSQVPSLAMGEKVLTQSLPLLLYLEDIKPKPSLLPQDSFKRAEVLSFCEMINSGIQPLQNLSVLKELESRFQADKKEWSKYWIEKGLSACEKFLKSSSNKSDSGLYCFSNELSLADLFLIPQIYNANRFGVDMKALTLLEKINEHCLKLEAFQKALPENQASAPKSEKAYRL